MDIRVSNTPSHTPGKSSFAGSLFEVIFLIIVIVVGYFYLVSPKQAQYGEVRTQLDKLEKDKSNLENQKKAFDRLVQELEKSPEQIAALDATLPLDVKPSKLYVLLENIIQSTGLTTSSVTVESDSQVVVAGGTDTEEKAFEAEHKLKPTVISVSGTGTVDQMTSVLRAIENNTRLLEINNLEVSQGNGEQILFRIGLKAYSYASTATR